MKRPRADILAPSAKKQQVAYPFVLDALAELEPTTRPMFGSHAVYLGERVLFILRKKGDADDGVWVAFDDDREADALAAVPNLAKITVLPNVRTWRKLAANRPTFEDDVIDACRVAGVPGGPLGRIPTRKRAKRPKRAAKKSRSVPKKAPPAKKKRTRRA